MQGNATVPGWPWRLPAAMTGGQLDSSAAPAACHVASHSKTCRRTVIQRRSPNRSRRSAW